LGYPPLQKSWLWFSPEICNEIIVDFSLATQRDIDALRSRVYFGLMLDESSDISAKKQVKLIHIHA
jgi:hypothetical protein